MAARKTAASRPAVKASRPGDKAPDNATLAKRLGLTVSEAERALGYKAPADKIFAVVDGGDRWGVVTADGAKHRVPKGA